MAPLPASTLTFLFTDIEGSTRLLQDTGERYAALIADHHRLLRSAFYKLGGQEVQDHGDGFYYSFPSAKAAVQAAVAAQKAILAHAWPEGAAVRVRMGLHTGEPVRGETGIVGLDIHRAARICAAGWGGQILLSQTTRDLVEDDLRDGPTLRELGEHVLKDLARPLRLYQLVEPGLPADFPALRSLTALPNNLPVQLTTFIGREREIGDVKRLLATTRLLTLTGIGGGGKTRLALQIAADALDQYDDGVWLVELAAVSNPDLVAQTVASGLGLQADLGGRHSIVQGLTGYLGTKRLLLILDNCEHLIRACATLAEDLLRACPRLRILATSREALGIAGELAFPVPGLSLPTLRDLDIDTLLHSEAARLFTERAMFSAPSFATTPANTATVAQICSRLDGIPLAIELAAARVKMLSADEIARRLDDRFRLLTGGSRTALPRHQTLQAAMDWSHDLLSEKERIVLRRLSVFAGGFTVEAAEGVCIRNGLGAEDIFDIITHLVDKSLVIADTRVGKTRYRLLEIVRQYARERLLEAGEGDAVRRLHADWFTAATGPIDPVREVQDDQAWLNRLEPDHDNFRAALEWLSGAAPESFLTLAGTLWYFWHTLGYIREGRGWLEAALAKNPAPTAARGRALLGAAQLANVQGDYQRSEAIGQEYLALARLIADRSHEGNARDILGDVALNSGRIEEATAHYEASVALFREAGDRWGMAMALRDLGNTAVERGDIARAYESYEQSLALYRGIGRNYAIAVTLLYFGTAAQRLGAYARATSLLDESLVLHRQVGARFRIGVALRQLAAVALAQGDYRRASELLEEAASLYRDIGDKGLISHVLALQARAAHEQGDLERAAALGNESVVLAQEVGNQRWEAFVKALLGRVAHDRGDERQAEALLREALQTLQERAGARAGPYARIYLAQVAHRRGALVDAAARCREALRIFGDQSEPRGLCGALEVLGSVTMSQGQPERAARLLGAAAGLRETIGAPVPPVDRPDIDATVAAIRDSLGADAYAAAFAAGRAMTRDEAVRYGMVTTGVLSGPATSSTP